MTPFATQAVDRQTALWNLVIPKRALKVDVGGTHVRYLHPTKGWRRVAKRRAGV